MRVENRESLNPPDEAMTLEELIESNPDPRELKRALTVKMRLEGLKHHQIADILGVPSSYISRWEQRYRAQGVKGLRLAYQGSQGFLSAAQRAETLQWLQQEDERSLWELSEYLERNYQLTYRSRQSYYDLLKAAGKSWHKGKKKPSLPAGARAAAQRAN